LIKCIVDFFFNINDTSDENILVHPAIQIK